MKKHLLQSGGSIKKAQGQDVDLAAITAQVTQLAQAGRISNRDANRILKGLKTVESSVADGVNYSLGRKNTFTAQKEGQDIAGKASGLNVSGNLIDRTLSGRKVSKAIGFIASQQKEVPNPEPIQPKGIVSNPIAPKDVSLPTIGDTTTAKPPGIVFTPDAGKISQKVGGETNQGTKKTMSAGKKNTVSSQKPGVVFSPPQKKNTQVPVTKTRLSAAHVEANKPLPKTVEEAIPVVDLWTVEDEAREQAARKATLQKAVTQRTLPASKIPSPQKTGSEPANASVAKSADTPGFWGTVVQWGNDATQRASKNAAIDQANRRQSDAAHRKTALTEEIQSPVMQEKVKAILGYFAKHPQEKSYRFFTWDGLTGRNYYTVTPDGKVTSEEDPSVEASYGMVQKKEDGGLTYSLGSHPLIDPKKRFIPAINPVGIDTSYQIPQKMISPSPSADSSQLQKAILPKYRIPMSKQVTTTTAQAPDGKGVDWLRVANAGLGLAGMLSYATAKRPVLPGPIKFESAIVPATGLSEASKRAALNQIAQQTAAASQLATTSDNRYNTAIKLQANYNANQALASLAAQDSEVYQQNVQRVNDQQNRDAFLNYQAQQNYNQQKFDLDNQYYQQRRDMGTQMAHNALNYEVQRKADMENKAVLEKQTNQQLAARAEQAIIQANTTRILQGKPVLTPAEEERIRQSYARYQTSQYSKPIVQLQP